VWFGFLTDALVSAWVTRCIQVMDKVAEPLPIDSTGNVLRRIAAASSVVLLIDARLIALDVARTVICSVSGKWHPHTLDLTHALGPHPTAWRNTSASACSD
jgi:hypothetical protein